MEKVDLGKNIKERRKFKHLSQAVLAEKANVSAQMIKDIEAGRRNPSSGTLNAICDALEITHRALYSDPTFINEVLAKGIRPLDLINSLSESLKSIPPEVFELAKDLGDDDEIWEDVIIPALEHARNRKKSTSLNKA